MNGNNNLVGSDNFEGFSGNYKPAKKNKRKKDNKNDKNIKKKTNNGPKIPKFQPPQSKRKDPFSQFQSNIIPNKNKEEKKDNQIPDGMFNNDVVDFSRLTNFDNVVIPDPKEDYNDFHNKQNYVVDYNEINKDYDPFASGFAPAETDKQENELPQEVKEDENVLRPLNESDIKSEYNNDSYNPNDFFIRPKTKEEEKPFDEPIANKDLEDSYPNQEDTIENYREDKEEIKEGEEAPYEEEPKEDENKSKSIDFYIGPKDFKENNNDEEKNTNENKEEPLVKEESKEDDKSKLVDLYISSEDFKEKYSKTEDKTSKEDKEEKTPIKEKSKEEENKSKSVDLYISPEEFKEKYSKTEDKIFQEDKEKEFSIKEESKKDEDKSKLVDLYISPEEFKEKYNKEEIYSSNNKEDKEESLTKEESKEDFEEEYIDEKVYSYNEEPEIAKDLNINSIVDEPEEKIYSYNDQAEPIKEESKEVSKAKAELEDKEETKEKEQPKDIKKGTSTINDLMAKYISAKATKKEEIKEKTQKEPEKLSKNKIAELYSNYKEKKLVVKEEKKKKRLIIIFILILLIGILIYFYLDDYNKNINIDSINIDNIGIIYVGEDKTVKATANGKGNLSKARFNFTLSNSEIISLDNNDEVVGKQVTKTLIPKDTGKFALYVEAKTVNDQIIRVERQVTICKRLSKDLFQSTSLSLKVGETSKLNIDLGEDDECNNSLSFTSSDNNIITIDDQGNINAKKEGKTTITIKVGDDTVNLDVNVIAKDASVKLTSISFSETEIVIEKGESIRLNVRFNPTNASNKRLTWKSSNTKYVKVVNGTVTGVAGGGAVVTATSEDGNHTAKITVNVIENLAKPRIYTITTKSSNSNSGYAKLDDTFTLTVEFDQTLGTKPQIQIANTIVEVPNSDKKYVVALKITDKTPEGAVNVIISGYKNKSGIAGNTVSGLVGNKIVIDKTKPTCSLTNSANNIKITGSDSYGIAGYIVDKATNTSSGFSSSLNYSIPGPGLYYGHVIDSAGNIGHCQITVN